ncbi:MAG TPA: EpsG family protein [Aurantimonas sp.]
MTIYLTIAATLTIFAILTVWRKEWATWAGIAASVTLIAFAGFRYRTGYDWPAYEMIFAAVPELTGAVCDGIPRMDVLVEPLFLWLNIAIKTFGGGIETMIFVVAMINIAMVHVVVSRISKSMAIVWLVYFGLIFLVAQMAVLRQALASSFALLALLLAVEKRPVSSVLSMIASTGFHITGAFFAPLLVLRRWRPVWWLPAAVIGVGVLAAISGVSVAQTVIAAVSPMMPDWIAFKLTFYAATKSAPISIGTAGLIGFHIVVLGVLYVAPTQKERHDPFVVMGIWVTIWVLVAHLFVSEMPIFWNRIMMVSIPWQIAAVYRLDAVRMAPLWLRGGSVAGLAVFSASALVYTLSAPSSAPYLPYQTVFEDHADPSDARLKDALSKSEYLPKGGGAQAMPEVAADYGFASPSSGEKVEKPADQSSPPGRACVIVSRMTASIEAIGKTIFAR